MLNTLSKESPTTYRHAEQVYVCQSVLLRVLLLQSDVCGVSGVHWSRAENCRCRYWS